MMRLTCRLAATVALVAVCSPTGVAQQEAIPADLLIKLERTACYGECLKELEYEIDQTALTQRWIRIDEPTLRQLVREGRLGSAACAGNLAVVQVLLAAGADPAAPGFADRSPLECALLIRL
jgi:ankyrin repeat protein